MATISAAEGMQKSSLYCARVCWRSSSVCRVGLVTSSVGGRSTYAYVGVLCTCSQSIVREVLS